MKKTILKGFPTEISEYIEMPDMAELLTYPIFYDTSLEDAYKYGSEFQRKLIDMTPLRKTKKNISVLSQVRLLDSSYRSCTGNSTKDEHAEWHIDCEEHEDGEHIYHEDRDIVHLFTNECSSMTEFNLNEMEIEWDYNLPYKEFLHHLYNNREKFNLKYDKMPSNRIVTFTNHLHRAVDPKKIEFKFMFRIVETNRSRKTSPYMSDNTTHIIEYGNKKIDNISQTSDRITIHIPKTILDSGKYKPLSPDAVVNDMNLSNNDSNSSTYVLEEAAWENSAIDPQSGLGRFTPKNSIMLFTRADYSGPQENREYEEFLDKACKKVEMYEVQNPTNTFSCHLKSGFFDSSTSIGPIAGIFLQFDEEQIPHISKNVEYKFRFNNESTHRFVEGSKLTFILR